MAGTNYGTDKKAAEALNANKALLDIAKDHNIEVFADINNGTIENITTGFHSNVSIGVGALAGPVESFNASSGVWETISP